VKHFEAIWGKIKFSSTMFFFRLVCSPCCLQHFELECCRFNGFSRNVEFEPLISMVFAACWCSNWSRCMVVCSIFEFSRV
jgi:hypothetical protein